MDASRINGMKIHHQAPKAPAVKAEAKKETKSAAPKDQVEIRGDQQAPEQDTGAVKPHKKWLFMNYVAADCNLTKYQLANIDQQELVGSDDNTHIVAYVDVGNNPAPMGFGEKAGEGQQPTPASWNGARTLYVTQDNEVGKLNSEVIEDHGTGVDMSSPETLKKFVIDAVKKFPADNVALIMNDHGGGFTGAMADDTDGDFMSMPQMKKALAEAQEITGKKIDIIGFDACLMAETEVAYSMKDVGDIMLASEENEGGPGWTYDSMLGGKVINEAINRTQSNLSKRINVSPYEFAKVVVDVNREHNDDIPTFSATDLKSMDMLKDATNNLAKAVIDTDDKAAIKGAIEGAENYGGGWAPYRDIRDLHHLSRNIMKNSSDDKVKKAAEQVKKAVEKAVFANEVNPSQHPESKGLSIYAPTSGSLGSDYKELSFAKDTLWDEAIESLGVKFDSLKKSPKVWPDGSARAQKK